MKKQNYFSFLKGNKLFAKSVASVAMIAMVFSLNLLPLTFSLKFASADEISDSAPVVESTVQSFAPSELSSDSESLLNESGEQVGNETTESIVDENSDTDNSTLNSSNASDVRTSIKADSDAIEVIKKEESQNGGGSSFVVVKEDQQLDLECQPADFDQNGVVDTRDVLAFLNAWRGEDPRTDLNADGLFTENDVFAFLAIFEDCSIEVPPMCFAPSNLGDANQQDLGTSSTLQTILDKYVDQNDQDLLDVNVDQKNYQLWDIEVSDVLGSTGLTCQNADWNSDGTVNTLDVLSYLNDWSAGGPDNLAADMNQDGEIDSFDFYIFLKLWKTCYSGNDIILDDGGLGVELISTDSDHPIAFGYYLNGDLGTFEPVFEVGNHSNYDVPELSEGDEINFFTPIFAGGEFTEDVGFAVDVEDIALKNDDLKSVSSQKFSTERSLNPNGDIQALVYDFIQDQFILAFEDTEYSNSDKDFDELVLRVTAKTCPDDGNGGDDGGDDDGDDDGDGDGGNGGGNNDDNNGGGGGSSGGGGHWNGDGRVLGASTEDIGYLEDQLQSLREELLRLLQQRLLELQAQLDNMDEGLALEGTPSQVLGVAEAQEIPEEEVGSTTIIEIPEVSTDDESTNWGRIALWVLFIIILIILLWLALRRKKTTDQ